eukprot:4429954-Amphidinium_carterae.1
MRLCVACIAIFGRCGCTAPLQPPLHFPRSPARFQSDASNTRWMPFSQRLTQPSLAGLPPL